MKSKSHTQTGRTIRMARAVLLSGALGILVAGEPAAAKLKFITFDAPGSTATQADAINSSGAVAGFYLDKSGNAQGFMRAPDGTFTTISHKGATNTYAQAINDADTVAGSYVSGDAYYAWVRTSDGKITDIPCPGDASGVAQSINNKGFIAGTCGHSPPGLGFVRDPGGNMTTFAPPNNGGLGVLFVAINASGEIGGSYDTAKGQRLGFVREPDGTITTYNAGGGKNWTDARCLNDMGTSAGVYFTDRPTHGFLRAADGAVTSFSLPKGGYQYTEGLCGIDSNDRVVGSYKDRGGSIYGYSRSSDGTITVIDPFGSIEVGIGCINKKGMMAGYYLAPGIVHGLIVKGTP